MINKEELNCLKMKVIEFIPLPEGYKLMMNDYNQYFITRGGKKKYFLTKRFILKLCNSGRELNKVINFTRASSKIEELIENTNNVKLKSSLEDILRDLNSEMFHEEIDT